MSKKIDRRELEARRHAHHIALRVTKQEGVFTLRERYGALTKLGSYRSVGTLRRGIWRHHYRMLSELDKTDLPPVRQ